MYFSFSATVRFIIHHFRNRMRRKSCYSKIPENRHIQNTETVKKEII